MDKQMALVEKLSSQIVQWEAEIARLEDKADRAGADEKNACLEAIKELQRKRQETQTRLQGIGTGNVDALKDLGKGTGELLDDVKGDLRDAVLKVK